MDLFEEYLDKKDTSRWVKIVLTDASYNSYRCRGVRANNPRFIEHHTPLKDNLDLEINLEYVLRRKIEDMIQQKKTREYQVQSNIKQSWM